MGNLLNDLIQWEEGQLGEPEEIDLFQRLVNTGLAWSLQGVYGRHAARLVEAGLIKPAET